MLQLQFLYLQTLNPKLCPLQSLSNSKPNPFSSISSTKNFLNIKKKKFLVKCRQSEYYEQKSFLTPPSNSSFASQNSTEAAGDFFCLKYANFCLFMFNSKASIANLMFSHLIICFFLQYNGICD